MLAQDAFQATSMLGSLHRRDVTTAGKHHRVSEDDARFQEIHAAVKLEGRRREIGGREIRESKIVAPEIPLILQTLWGKHRHDAEILLANEDRHESRLPPMHMDRIRRFAAGNLDDAF